MQNSPDAYPHLLDARNAQAQCGNQIHHSVGQKQYDPVRHGAIGELLAAADAAMYSPQAGVESAHRS
ncbi:UNVERIFIED_ORG: hypothetical protein ABIC54_005870 [Burkholderia sp. 1263]